MEWIEWLLSREFREFVFDHDLFIPLLFTARVLVVTSLEWMMPAREVPYRSILLMDVVGAALVGYLLLPAALYVSERIVIRPVLPEFISALPTAAAFTLYYVVGDFGAYRNLGIFYENAVNRILQDIVKACRPVWAKVTGTFTARGGLSSKIEAKFPN